MKSEIEKKLENLSKEYATGEKMLLEIETKRSNLKQTMLRISGAIQVLEELTASSREAAPETANEKEKEFVPT